MRSAITAVGVAAAAGGILLLSGVQREISGGVAAGAFACTLFYSQNKKNVKNLGEQDAEDYRQQGLLHSERKDFERAIECFTFALAITPDSALLYSNRGASKMQSGDLNGAIDDFNAALELDKDYATPLANRGIAKLNLGDLNGAFLDCSQALKVDNNCTIAYLYRGMINESLGNIEDAIKDFDQVSQSNPDDALTLARLAVLYALAGKSDLASAHINAAMNLEPDNEYVLERRSEVLSVINQNEKSENHFTSSADNKDLGEKIPKTAELREKVVIGLDVDPFADKDKNDALYSWSGGGEHYKKVIRLGSEIGNCKHELERLQKVLSTSDDPFDVHDAWVALKIAVLRMKRSPHPLDESIHLPNRPLGDALGYADHLNSTLVRLWECTRFADEFKNPPHYLYSEWDPAGLVQVSWCHPSGDPYGNRLAESCFYFIDKDGIAYVREYLESLDLNYFNGLLGLCGTVIEDLVGGYDMDSAIQKLLEDAIAEQQG